MHRVPREGKSRGEICWVYCITSTTHSITCCFLTLTALKRRCFLVPRHTLQLPILAAILRPNTRSTLPSIKPNLDNPRGLVSLSVGVLTESAWDTCFLSFPMFRRAPPYIVLVLRLRIAALFWYRHSKRVHAFLERLLAPHVSASLYAIEFDCSIGDTREFSPVLNYTIIVV